MQKPRDEAYASRLFSYVLWNEILTGQTLESVHKLSDSMGVEFPGELLKGPYHLLVTGLERRAYRMLGIDAVSYDNETYAYYQKVRGRILQLGYDAAFAMQIYDDTKPLIFVLKPVSAAAPPIE